MKVRRQRQVARVSTRDLGLVDAIQDSRPVGDDWVLVASEHLPNELELVWEREVQVVPPRHWRPRLRRPRSLRGA